VNRGNERKIGSSLPAGLFEPAKAIIRARRSRAHRLNFAEHISKQPLVALTCVFKPHDDSSKDSHVAAQARNIGDKTLILANQEIQIGFRHNRPYKPATTG
jgi:hypothetical protein